MPGLVIISALSLGGKFRLSPAMSTGSFLSPAKNHFMRIFVHTERKKKSYSDSIDVNGSWLNKYLVS